VRHFVWIRLIIIIAILHVFFIIWIISTWLVFFTSWSSHLGIIPGLLLNYIWMRSRSKGLLVEIFWVAAVSILLMHDRQPGILVAIAEHYVLVACSIKWVVLSLAGGWARTCGALFGLTVCLSWVWSSCFVRILLSLIHISEQLSQSVFFFEYFLDRNEQSHSLIVEFIFAVDILDQSFGFSHLFFCPKIFLTQECLLFIWDCVEFRHFLIFYL